MLTISSRLPLPPERNVGHADNFLLAPPAAEKTIIVHVDDYLLPPTNAEESNGVHADHFFPL